MRPVSNRIGWIGTGVMGAPMCGHLVDAGCQLTVFNRSNGRAIPLLERGAIWAESPREVATRSDVVFTMVGFPRDVREVVLGPQGVLAGAAAGATLVDMTTSEPELAREIYDASRGRGVCSLDAPVSGGDVGARAARLSIMVGGDHDAFESVRPLLAHMGATITYVGPAGSGQHTKMVNQILVASGMIGVCEALLYGYRAGLEPERMLEAVMGGAAGSWALTNYAPRILGRDFAPGFLVDHFVKDLRIALDEAKRLGLSLPGVALAERLYVELAAQGHGKRGTHALILALARLSNLVWD